MSRSLRARKEIDYSQLFTFEDDDPTAGGPSTSSAPRKPLIIEEDDSGSDFEVGKAGEPVEEEEDDDDGKSAVLSDVDDGDVKMHNVEGDDADDADDVVVGVVAKAAASKASVARSIAQRGTVQLAPGLAHKSRRQMHARPLPSVHHRHRFLPLIRRVAPVERLVARPLPFPPLGTNGVVDHTTKTKSGTADNTIIDRTNRACGYNVGPGPVWELVEDRAWFKEARTGGEDEWMEACRRPQVYSDLVHKVEVKVLSFEDARPFLPHGGDVNPNSESPAPLPSVPCYMGPVKNQTLIDLPTFKSKPMSDLFPKSTSHVFNAGGPIWGLDWCPIHPDHRKALANTHYLSIGSWPSTAYAPEIGRKVTRPAPACIQIWSLGSAQNGAQDDEQDMDGHSRDEVDTGIMRCELVLCIDVGPAHELKWCPLPSHQDLIKLHDASTNETSRQLGYLAGTFQDGSLSIFEVPFPADVRPRSASTDSDPVFVKVNPILRTTLGATSCWSLAWANSERLAVGCTNGSIAVFDVKTALTNPDLPMTPTHYIAAHQSAIRSLAWVTAPPPSALDIDTSSNIDLDLDLNLNREYLSYTSSPDTLVSTGYDGVLSATSLPLLRASGLSRTRDALHACAFSCWAGAALGTDHEHVVKAYSLAPSMLGRGHLLCEPRGPSWSIGASDYHPQIAVASADGSVSTTNTFRSTRRSGRVPFLVHRVFRMEYSVKGGVEDATQNDETDEQQVPGKDKGKQKQTETETEKDSSKEPKQRRKPGVWRMTERYLPLETQERPNNSTAKGAAGNGNAPSEPSVGVWPTEQAATRTCWHSGAGVAGASWLASGTMSGLGRVNWLEGRWLGDRMPYGETEVLRQENETPAVSMRTDGVQEDELDSEEDMDA